MARPTIANFNGSYIAMPFGANQYFVMHWDNNQRQWFPYEPKLVQEGQPQNEVPHIFPMAALQGLAPGGEIHLHKPRRQRQQQHYKVNFVTTDRYIKAFLRPAGAQGIQQTNIPILNKTGGDRIPPCFTRNLNVVYDTPDPPAEDHLLRGELWGLRQQGAPVVQEVGELLVEMRVAQPRGGPPMNVRPASIPPLVKLEPIPRRIAWLIAEVAQKQNESCGITFDEISPLTAAVTTCFHCFEANALEMWFQQATANGQERLCPLCRKSCLHTKAYEDTGGYIVPAADQPGDDGVIEIHDDA